MRNYIKELHDSGLTYKDIASQTGINRNKLSKISRGLESLKSGTSAYNTIRNLSRKTAYNKLIKSGLNPERASKYRRIGLSEKTYSHKTTRTVKHTSINKSMFQLKLLAEFINTQSKKTRIIECFSLAHAKIDVNDFSMRFLSDDLDEIIDDMSEIESVDFDENQELLSEAIRDGQGKLGGSHWELKRIIDIELIHYKIG